MYDLWCSWWAVGASVLWCFHFFTLNWLTLMSTTIFWALAGISSSSVSLRCYFWAGTLHNIWWMSQKLLLAVENVELSLFVPFLEDWLLAIKLEKYVGPLLTYCLPSAAIPNSALSLLIWKIAYWLLLRCGTCVPISVFSTLFFLSYDPIDPICYGEMDEQGAYCGLRGRSHNKMA